MKVRFIDTKSNNAYLNMAIDEALLTSKLPILRFYTWKPTALSIGYFQKITSLNKTNLKKHKINLVRRLTGGNAVLHDKELTYSFIIDEKLMPKSIISSYKKISKGLLQGLKNLNLTPTLNTKVLTKQKSPVCFNDPSWYEILVKNKKIIGSAQKRINKKILQHGAILLSINTKKYLSLFKNQKTNLKNRITSINNESKTKITLTKLKKAIKQGFKTSLNLQLINSQLTTKELKLAKQLYKDKYSQDNWNLKW